MEPQVKQRITGAIVLVVLVVIFVPALLTGPRHPPASPPAEPGQPPLQTYRSDLKGSSAAAIPPNAEPAPPEPQRANADDAVAPVTAGDGDGTAAGPAAREPAPAHASAPRHVAPPAAPPARKAASRASSPVAAVKPPVAAAPTPPKPAASAAGAWAVQLGGFSSRSNAQKLVAELKEQGFSAHVTDASSAGHPLFRVRSGPVHDRAAADALLKRLKAKGHPGSAVTNP